MDPGNEAAQKIVLFFFKQMSDFSRTDWWRAMFDTDRGNDVMVGQFGFFPVFFSSARLYEKFKRKWIPTVNVIVKTNWQQFSMICTLIDHRK